MLIWKRKSPAKIHDDDLRAAVLSRNRQSNHDTWEINITLVLVALVVSLVLIFQVEMHDFLLSIFMGGE